MFSFSVGIFRHSHLLRAVDGFGFYNIDFIYLYRLGAINDEWKCPWVGLGESSAVLVCANTIGDRVGPAIYIPAPPFDTTRERKQVINTPRQLWFHTRASIRNMRTHHLLVGKGRPRKCPYLLRLFPTINTKANLATQRFDGLTGPWRPHAKGLVPSHWAAPWPQPRCPPRPRRQACSTSKAH